MMEKIFHSGTKIDNGNFVTNGGRVLSVTALGINLQVARPKPMKGIKFIGKVN